MTEPAISDFDLHLFGEGNHQRIHDKLGAHPHSSGAESGTRFAVWAPRSGGQGGGATVICVFNATPVPRDAYEVGVAQPGRYRKLFDSDAAAFGGSGYNRQSEVEASRASAVGHAEPLRLNLPPLGAVFFVGP